MEKKYFTISIILNTLFYITSVSVPAIIQYLFGIEATWVLEIILLLLFIILPAIFGIIYLFFAENKRWVILGLLIDFFTIILLFLVFSVLSGLQSRRT